MRIPSRWRGTEPARNDRIAVSIWQKLQFFSFICVVFLAKVCASPQLAPDEVPDTETPDRKWDLVQRIATDRKIVTAFQSLQDSLAEEKSARAVDEFRRLQTADPFSLVPTHDGPASAETPVFVPLYRALFASAFDLPPEAARSLIATSEDAAGKSLSAILENESSESLPRLICKFAGTDASIKAHFVLARVHLDRGNLAAAKNWLRPILNPNIAASYKNQAAQILSQLDARHQNSTSTDARATAEIPRHVVWQSRTTASPKLRSQIETFQIAANAARVAPQTTWQAVIDQQTMFRRTLRGVEAMNLNTGDALWEYPIGFGLDAVISSDRVNAGIFGESARDPNSPATFARMDQSPLANAFCRDNLLGGVSDDARNVYAVTTDGKYQPSTSINRGFQVNFGNRFSGNKLIAINKATGARVWSLGRSTFEEHLGPADADCWIAGPPETAGKDMFCVFEWNGEIRLGCVAANTGEIRWSTALAFPEQSIEKDSVRRLWGSRPLRDGGLIWCLTTAGWIVCVDEVSHAIVYATAIQNANNNESENYSGRGQPVVFTRPASLSDRWSDSVLLNFGDALIAMSQDSHDIVVLESTSGRPIRRIAAEPGTVVVHIDSDNAILGTPNVLKCVELNSGNEKWSHTIPPTEGFATGKGIQRGSHMLAPMSTGAIASIDLTTGETVELAERVLPEHGWGKLVQSPSLQGDIMYVAPDRMTRISANRREYSPRDPVEVASALMAAGKPLEALQMVNSVPETDLSREEAQSIAFKCRLQLAAAQPETYLQQLKDSSLSADQLIQVQVLEASVSLTQERFDIAATQIVRILGLSSSVLSKPAPNLFAVSDRPEQSDDFSKSEANSESKPLTSQSLLTWAASRLGECLDRTAMTADLKDAIDGLPDNVLLNIHHASIRSVLLKHAEKSNFVETALHLIHHSAALQKAEGQTTTDSLLQESQLLVSQLQKMQNVSSDKVNPPESGWALRQLVHTLIEELPEPLKSQVSMTIREPGKDELIEGLSRQFADWNETSYVAVPVTRFSSSIRNSGTMMAAETNDSFLKHYRWSAVQGEYGRILAESVERPGEQWSIPGNFENYGTYSNRTDILSRLGSVLLLQTFRAITAISIADGNVLWVKPMNSQSGVSFSITQLNSFSNFVAGRHHLPSWQAYSPYRVVGAGSRWVCVRHGLRLEVIDLLSGQVSWSTELADSQSHVIASDDVVIVRSSATAKAICFNRTNGRIISNDNAERLAGSAIRNVDEMFVCWDFAKSEDGHRLSWVDSLSGKTTNEVSLEDAVQFHFLDDRTLIGINEQQQFLSIDLVDGSVQKCSFRIDGEDTPVDSVAAEEGPNSGPPDLPMWSPARLQVTRDPLNYYISNRAGNNSSNRQPFGRQMMRFEGGLRAIDRTTGNVRWWFYNDQSLLASTDQPELAVLVLVEDNLDNPVAGNSGLGRNMFRGVSKLHGRQLFSQPIPSQYGIRYISIDSPDANVLDIGVQGMKIRLEGQPDEVSAQ